jgi:hypothetical protein
MAVFTLESLVLRGVSVRCDGSVLNLRLGASVEPTVRISAIGNSMYPLSDARPDDTQPVAGPNHQVPHQVEKPAIDGAGRSHSVGTPRRLTAATTARWAASHLEAPGAGLFAGRQEKRIEERSEWRKPARRTPPSTTRGTRSR